MVASLTSAGVYYIRFYDKNLPNLNSFIKFEAPTIGTIYDKNGKIIVELAKEYRRIADIDEIPPIMKEALLSAEDQRFYWNNNVWYWHNGIDWVAIVRAFIFDVVHSVRSSERHKSLKIEFRQGASTLTQQIVRLYFLPEITSKEEGNELIWNTFWTRQTARLFGPSKTNKIFRKLEEMRLALWLERELTKPEYFGSRGRVKEEIFSRYASYVYVMNGRYGFVAGSEFYFNKKIVDFTEDDADKAALLAGIIKNPGLYAPAVNSDKLQQQQQLSRRNGILDLMVDNGFIEKDMVNNFKQRDLPKVEKGKIKTVAPSVVGDIFKELRENKQNVEDLFNGRIQIKSTVILEIQNIVNQALENAIKAYEDRHPEARGLVQGCVVVLRNSDGAILAQAGGRRSYKNQTYRYSDLNRVTYSARQPGSAFKPFNYLTAFRNGWTLEKNVIDDPIFVAMGSIQVGKKWVRRPPKKISNYDGKYKGAIPTRKALAESRNAAAIWLVRNNGGIEPVIETAKILGIKTPLQPYITTALGASEVNLMELTNAYRALVSGLLASPYMIEKVSDRLGNTVFLHSATPVEIPEDLISEEALNLIREGLRGVVRLPSGTAHSLDNKNFGIPILGKTGTTNDFKDAWFIGSTYGPEGIIVGAKIGFDDPSRGYDKDDNFGVGPRRGLGEKESGGRVALPIVKEIISSIYKNNLVGPIPGFPEEIEKNIDNYLSEK